ncbi:MAG: DNA primase [Christensenellales bacterium]
MRLISRYVPLNKGQNLLGCCPFHHEKEPSFAVNEEKQFYHCFGCKESGNAISFVQKMESVDFIDAVRLLAAEAKMEVPELKKFKNEGISREKRERLYSLMRAAAKHYYDNLFTDGGKRARDYLGMRQVPDKLVTKFGFGASLGSKEIINFLESKGFTKSEMKEAGLIEQRGADWYDVFYDRMMIPIINNFGEVVAFGGRLINPESHIPVKYRNSSNTPIFDKSKTLYAINLLKKKKQREPIKNVIVCEGYMDVLALHKAGFDTAVASMGTALTMQQAKLIRNYSTNVYICYDGDSAGQTATMRGLDILQAAGLNVKVVSLPDELDPDDFIKARGAAAYQNFSTTRLRFPRSNSTFSPKFDLGAPDGKTAYAIEAIK